MTTQRTETLKKHLTELAETKRQIELKNTELKALTTVWNAKGEAFNTWLHKEIGLTAEQTEDVLMPEILLKWAELNEKPLIIT